MTYNFDTEAWLERQQAWLRARRQRGELDDEQLAAALAELDRRFEEMEARLGGAYFGDLADR